MNRRLIGVVSGVVLTVAACGGDDPGGGSAAAGGDGMALEIISPEPGAEIGFPFTVEFESSEELGPTEEGVHHVHVYFDGDDSEYEVVEGDSWEVTTIDAPAGEHTLNASLRNADHSAAGVETEITVTVVPGGADTGDDDDGLDY